MKTRRERNNFFLRQHMLRIGPKATKFSDSITSKINNLQEFDDNLSNSKESGQAESSLEEWLRCPDTVLMHPQLFPSKSGYALYHRLVKNIDKHGGINQYLGITQNDPHLLWALINLRDLIQEIGGDPDNQTTVLNFRPSLLLSLGTGDGSLLKRMIDELKPYHLCIAIRCWDDLISSFDNIEWIDEWNIRCNDSRSRISIIPYENCDQLRVSVIEHALVSCEHACVVVPSSDIRSDSIYLDDRKHLKGHEMSMTVDYLGFTIDEYNMMWNTVKTLKKYPRIFKSPVKPIGGRYIVCGSGPSLDKNLPLLQNLPSDITVVACASNYRTLRSAGIEVDILCLLERGPYEADNYLSIKNEFGLGKTCLLASVTCDARLHDLFEESAVYFRPALTPLSIFSTDPRQILNHEGPQTVNTGVALCAALGADEVILVGVDLGTTSLDKVRSDQAVGCSEREFDQKEKGNFVELVYTSKFLVDGRLAMEFCLKSYPGIKVFNASDGVYIKGAQPLMLTEWLATSELHSDYNFVKTKIKQWWHDLQSPSLLSLQNQWKAARPRVDVSITIEKIKKVLESDLPWFPCVQDELSDALKLANIPVHHQIGRRFCRATLLKLAIVISRQCYVLLAQDNSGLFQDAFLKSARKIMLDVCNHLETEIYELFDQLEVELFDYEESANG